MILRNAPVRHCRHTMASPISRSILRRMSTQVTTKTEATPEVKEWTTSQTASAPPKIVSAARKKQRIVQDGILSLRTNSAHEHKGSTWTTPHKNSNSATPATPAQQYREWQRIQANTRSLGSKLVKRYIPTELVNNPPGPEDITLELLLASQTHIGHKTSLWNPANSRYIYGVRQGVHMISLETTAAHLRRAARVVEEVAYKAGLILFVGNRKGQMEIVTQAAEMAGACHLFTKWTPGGITNRDVILKMAGTKVVDHKDVELPGFENYRGSARPLMPDLVVCLNPLENYTLLYECGLKSIPTIGVIDTNVDPSWVTYTIPANDDSLRAMAVVGGVLGRAGQRGYQRRMADAKKDKSTWQNPPDIVQHMSREKKVAIAERKNVMGQMQHNLEGFNEEEQKILREQFYGEEPEAADSDLVKVMAEAASVDVNPTVSGSTSDSRLTSIEEELSGLKAAAEAIEAETHSATKPTEPAPASSEQPIISEVVVEAQVEAQPAELSPDSRLASIEEQLSSLKAVAEAIEAEAQSATKPTESAPASSEEPVVSQVVVEAQVETQPAESTSDSRLTSIEEQLSGLKDAAEAIEADIKSGKQ
ncbi:30s ribosomal protein s2 [Fusarium sporotrichioides]|uniref:30s ribosomal protein s2 n=1 Tax=Fusarium sporotrichioides TaxID=5514 RepID=A0A395RHX4_FUSSP|nr:30s ribosomal protein s2 [Fusarium sporotrichioides]